MEAAIEMSMTELGDGFYMLLAVPHSLSSYDSEIQHLALVTLDLAIIMKELRGLPKLRELPPSGETSASNSSDLQSEWIRLRRGGKTSRRSSVNRSLLRNGKGKVRIVLHAETHIVH